MANRWDRVKGMGSRHKIPMSTKTGADGILQNYPDNKERAVLCGSLKPGLKILNKLNTLLLSLDCKIIRPLWYGKG